jgi:hypothetical protein
VSTTPGSDAYQGSRFAELNQVIDPVLAFHSIGIKLLKNIQTIPKEIKLRGYKSVHKGIQHTRRHFSWLDP